MKRAQISLEAHAGFRARREMSQARLDAISKDLVSNPHVVNLDGTIFAAGSYGRLEAGPRSDLDIFVIEEGDALSSLDKVRLLGAVADINDSNSCPPFDGAMRFFKVYSAKELISHTGQPVDDTENSFTARMLLLLEGRPVFGDQAYGAMVEAIVGNYFRDNKGKKDFRPLFLLNDLLRYWRTLCLNYEEARSDPDRKWRKKNLNLRFSRLSTVFATVVLLLTFRPSKADQFLPYVNMTPFERLAAAVDDLNDAELDNAYSQFLEHYHWFLALKDEKGDEHLLGPAQLSEARSRANEVSTFFDTTLSNSNLLDLRRYLVL